MRSTSRRPISLCWLRWGPLWHVDWVDWCDAAAQPATRSLSAPKASVRQPRKFLPMSGKVAFALERMRSVYRRPVPSGGGCLGGAISKEMENASATPQQTPRPGRAREGSKVLQITTHPLLLQGIISLGDLININMLLKQKSRFVL